MEPAMTIQDFLPWVTFAALTIGILWIVIQNVSSKLSSQIEATNVRIEAVGKVGESNITRIEAAIQAGAKEHEQFRSDIKDTNRRLDSLYSLMLERIPAKDAIHGSNPS